MPSGSILTNDHEYPTHIASLLLAAGLTPEEAWPWSGTSLSTVRATAPAVPPEAVPAKPKTRKSALNLLTEEQQLEAIELYRSGQGIKPIAAFYKIAPESLRKIFIARNVLIKPRGRNQWSKKATD